MPVMRPNCGIFIDRSLRPVSVAASPLQAVAGRAAWFQLLSAQLCDRRLSLLSCSHFSSSLLAKLGTGIRKWESWYGAGDILAQNIADDFSKSRCGVAKCCVGTSSSLARCTVRRFGTAGWKSFAAVITFLHRGIGSSLSCAATVCAGSCIMPIQICAAMLVEPQRDSSPRKRMWLPSRRGGLWLRLSLCSAASFPGVRDHIRSLSSFLSSACQHTSSVAGPLGFIAFAPPAYVAVGCSGPMRS